MRMDLNRLFRVFVFFNLLFNMISVTYCDPLYWGYSCSSSNLTAPAFKANLQHLLPLLSGSATANPAAGFFNATAGRSPDQVFGLSMCWANVDADRCQICLRTAVTDVGSGQACGEPGNDVSTSAAVWYADCFLRYSDSDFFSVVNTDYSWVPDELNVTAGQTGAFRSALARLMGSLSSEASSSPEKFAVGTSNMTGNSSVYGLLQCTRDLSDRDCSRCLDIYISQVPIEGRRRGASVYGLSCYLRYEIYPFFFQGTPQLIPHNKETNVSGTVVILIASVAAFIILICTCICLCLWRWRTIRNPNNKKILAEKSPFNDFESLKVATRNFSDEYKLGEGGFGAVYKGILPDGQEIAVKMLSENSIQGIKELQNEIELVARLEHKNLARLLGYCLEEEKKLIVFEYMPNKSLDMFLFDSDLAHELNWRQRFKIIEGICNGLVYLHEDARVKIVHRDLKASNILLDENLCPKIADFGIARLFDNDKTHQTATKLIGTLGYMAPEYVLQSNFSPKSDVFSFGILVLEIITGRSVCSFRNSEPSSPYVSLVGYVKNLWNEGRIVEVKDPRVGEEEWPEEELRRCAYLGLQCAQEKVEDRPDIREVNLMLYSNRIAVPSVQFSTDSQIISLV